MLEVRPRTIFGDLKELKQDLGVDIRFDKMRRGYCLVGDQWQLNFWDLDEDSAILLTAACRLIACTSGDAMIAPLRALFDAETDRCLKSLTSPVDEFGKVLQFEIHQRPISKDIFLELCKACAKENTVKILHSKGMEFEECQFRPLFLIYKHDGWKIAFEDDSIGMIREIDIGSIAQCSIVIG
jgi:predicted DNA-binding transcriptional regulator YafY